jgi:predicted metalloprotease with PDZ domain
MRSALCVVFLLLAVLTGRAADPRPIEISVDLTDAPRRLFRAKLVIPAEPGPITLEYPKWIPGEHQPSGPIIDLSGLKFRAGGKVIPWTRDDVDLYAFHLTVPEGAGSLDAELEYLVPGEKGGYGAGPASTAKLAILNWYLVTLYPKGKPAHDILVRANLTLPSGWQAGTALPIESKADNKIQYKTAPLDTFVDSPALCGIHFKEVPIGPKDGPPHFLTMACDSAAGLALSDEVKGQYDRLVVEAGELFGARHYRSYRFLMAMTDQFGHNAIEHHESSDNRLPERMLIDDVNRKTASAWVLAHEYVHSWNGKFRRPAGMVTPSLQEPHKTRLLWVYEGLTEYLGYVLAARSGLYTKDLSRDNLARIAAWAKTQVGRTWRPLEDTAAAAPHLYTAPREWEARRRGVDFYDEGALLWLDADTLIREKTDGKKSLDDFCKAFYGGPSGAPEVKPYTFEDVVAALNGVVEYDWKGFLEKRLTSTDPEPPVDGITRGGWKLVYGKERSELQKAVEGESKTMDLTTSLGLMITDSGLVIDVVPNSAADRAGLGPHMKVLAVNDRKFAPDGLREAVAATAGGKEKVALIVENGEFVKTYPLDYAGGERYPRLEREAGTPDRIGEIFKAKGK